MSKKDIKKALAAEFTDHGRPVPEYLLLMNGFIAEDFGQEQPEEEEEEEEEEKKSEEDGGDGEGAGEGEGEGEGEGNKNE